MIRLTEEKSRAISSIQRNPSFNKIIELLQEEQEFCIKGLMTAKEENFKQLQGRTKLLEELLNIFQA